MATAAAAVDVATATVGKSGDMPKKPCDIVAGFFFAVGLGEPKLAGLMRHGAKKAQPVDESRITPEKHVMTQETKNQTTRSLLLDRVGPVRDEPPFDRVPVYKTMLYTLDISARFLASAAVGRGSVARADELIDGYWRRIFKAGNASLSVEGRENFGDRPCLVMSNHTSLLDIPAIMGAVPGSMRMVLKQELTRVPIWGPALVKSGFVPVKRGSKAKAIEQLAVAKKVLAQGVHIWIAPEGTRSRNGELAKFKKGGFHLALDLGTPIIPTWIEGASDIIPPDGFGVRHDGAVTVRFGEPVETGNWQGTLDELITEVRQRMLRLGGKNAVEGKQAA